MMEVDMASTLAKGLATAVVTEVAADTAVIGGVMAATRKSVPGPFVAVAGCIAVAGLAMLVRMLPVLEDEVIKTAAEQGWLDKMQESRA